MFVFRHRQTIGLATLALAVGAWSVTPAIAAPATYQFDESHTEVRFSWNHVGLSDQSAEFGKVTGTVVFDEDNPEASSVSVTIPVDAVDSGVDALDDHFKSADFFDVAKYPNMTFESTSVKRTGANTGIVTGNLTVKDVTKPVTLDVTFNFSGEHPLGPFIDSYKGAYYTAFSAQTRLLRSDFGLGLYVPLTSDDIDITIETELRRVD